MIVALISIRVVILQRESDSVAHIKKSAHINKSGDTAERV